jgi:Ser/Thr protein kinase RdoA (MazF antagonist)
MTADPNQLAREALQAWSIEPRQIVLVHSAPNIVYRVSSVTGDCRVLRLTPDARRSPEQIEAELHFVHDLAARGLETAAPVAAVNGRLLVRGLAGGAYHAALFEFVEGRPLRWSTNEQNLGLFNQIGQTLAKLHAVASSYQPLPGAPRRFSWDDDASFLTLHERLPDFEADVKREAEAIFQFLRGLPRTGENYGLVHGDFTLANLLLQGERLVVIDFDDCCYHWYAFDIAVGLNAAARLPTDVRAQYERQLLSAYASARRSDAISPNHLRWFQRLVNLTRYYYALRNWDLVNLSPAQVKELEQRRDAVVAGARGSEI